MCCTIRIMAFGVETRRGVLVLVLAVAAGCAHVAPAPGPAGGAPPGFRSEDAMDRAIRKGRVPRTTVGLVDLGWVVVSTDVAYADRSPRNVLDVYRPRVAEGPWPVVVFVHGGAWDHGDKKLCAPYALHFAQRGYLCVSMNYRLSTEAPYPAAVDDVRAALAWVRDHASDYGGDGARIALVGQSAGAHLAMMAAYEDAPGAAAPACVVEFYGPADLAGLGARNAKAVRRFLGATYREDPPRYRAASPLTHMSPQAPPTLLIHGTVDDKVPVRQADALAKAIEGVGVPCVYERIEGWGHAMDRAQPVFDYCACAMDRFFERHLRQ